MTTERAAPSTEAGRALLASEATTATRAGIPRTTLAAAILAIEKQARAEAAREATDQQVVNAWRHALTADDYTDSWTADLARGRRFLAAIDEASPVDLDELSPARASFTNGQT